MSEDQNSASLRPSSLKRRIDLPDILALSSTTAGPSDAEERDSDIRKHLQFRNTVRLATC
jgi:hypothetical protein